MTRPDEWFTLDEAARACRRSRKTIRNLVSEHQLPRRLLWEVRQRLRRRVMFLSPATVAYLQRVTLEGADPAATPKPRS